METKLIKEKNMPPRLNKDCDSGWSKIQWPKEANVLLATLTRIQGVIVGYIKGWPAGREHRAFYVGKSQSGGLLLSPSDYVDFKGLKSRKLYFATVDPNESDPIEVAKIVCEAVIAATKTNKNTA